MRVSGRKAEYASRVDERHGTVELEVDACRDRTVQRHFEVTDDAKRWRIGERVLRHLLQKTPVTRRSRCEPLAQSSSGI